MLSFVRRIFFLLGLLLIFMPLFMSIFLPLHNQPLFKHNFMSLSQPLFTPLFILIFLSLVKPLYKLLFKPLFKLLFIFLFIVHYIRLVVCMHKKCERDKIQKRLQKSTAFFLLKSVTEMCKILYTPKCSILFYTTQDSLLKFMNMWVAVRFFFYFYFLLKPLDTFYQMLHCNFNKNIIKFFVRVVYII